MADIQYPIHNPRLNPNYMDLTRLNIFLTDPTATITDVVNTGLTYYGYTLPGVLDTEPFWKVRKEITVGGLTHNYYSNTGKTFTNIWNDRTGLTYW